MARRWRVRERGEREADAERASAAAQCKMELRFDDSQGEAPRQALTLVAESPADAARWLRAFSKTESRYATRMASDWLDRTI